MIGKQQKKQDKQNLKEIIKKNFLYDTRAKGALDYYVDIFYMNEIDVLIACLAINRDLSTLPQFFEEYKKSEINVYTNVKRVYERSDFNYMQLTHDGVDYVIEYKERSNEDEEPKGKKTRNKSKKI